MLVFTWFRSQFETVDDLKSPMSWREFCASALAAMSLSVVTPAASWLSTTAYGTHWLGMAPLLAGMAAFLAVVASPCLVLLLPFRRARRAGVVLLALAVLTFANAVAAVVFGNATRMAGMGAFTRRSAPLVEAIKAYDRDHGEPPPHLDALLPDYLPEVPSTGMRAYPEYRYSVWPGKSPAWTLAVSTGWGLSFDEMLYFPDHDYPARGYGGVLERVGDWAYVHE